MSPLLVIVAGFVFGCISAVVASSRGRFPMPWFFAGLFLGPLGLILTAILVASGPVPAQTAESEFDAAIKRGDVNLMRQMIEGGAIDPNGRAPDGKHSWLRVAVNNDGIDQAETLLKLGAEPTLVDGSGRSALDYLREKVTLKTSSRRALLDLLESPPEVELRTPSVMTPNASVPEATSLERRLTELASLKERGLLSDEEFSVAKARILSA